MRTERELESHGDEVGKNPKGDIFFFHVVPSVRISIDIHVRIVIIFIHIIIFRVWKARWDGSCRRYDSDTAGSTHQWIVAILHNWVDVLRPLRLVLTACQLVNVVFQCLWNVRFSLTIKKKLDEVYKEVNQTMVNYLGEILIRTVGLVQT